MTPIMHSLLALATLSVALAHPAGLECGTDATSRLKIGATIMGTAVTEAPANQTSIAVTVTGHHVQIKAAAGVYFAVRAFGDGAALFDFPAPILATANCSVQGYLNGTVDPPPAKIYTLQHNDKTDRIVVAYATPESAGAVSLVTTKLGEGCPATTYCCPEANKCLKPTSTSCKDNANACGSGEVCCPLTKICVVPGADCASPCSGTGSYCCPDAKHCLTPTNPGVFCDTSNPCNSGEVCCPLTKLCVSVGGACAAR